MYVADWFLFYERKQISWKLPLISISAPLIYVIFIYIRAWILHFDSSVPYIYPYFFLDLEKQGLPGVLKWIVILLVGFIALGYIMYGLDRITRKKALENKELEK
jgi:amino acid transporter